MAVRAWWGLALALPTMGCARGITERMIERRAYDEAICVASERSRDPVRDVGRVRQRLDQDARPRLHLHAVPPAELSRSLGSAGERLAEQAVLVRAVTAIDAVQVDGFQMEVVLHGRDGPVAMLEPRVETIAALVGETVPPGTVEVDAGGRELVTRRFAERPILGMTAGLFEAATLFIVPVTVMTGHTRSRPERVIHIPPEEAELAAAAPVAWMVAHQAEQLSGASGSKGWENSSVWLWARSDHEPLSLSVRWRYQTNDCMGRRPRLVNTPSTVVEVDNTVELPLPPGPDLAVRINAVFGDRMRLLAR